MWGGIIIYRKDQRHNHLASFDGRGDLFEKQFILHFDKEDYTNQINKTFGLGGFKVSLGQVKLFYYLLSY
jgi:hypothetical protein